jgi:hypothetical protein
MAKTYLYAKHPDGTIDKRQTERAYEYAVWSRPTYRLHLECERNDFTGQYAESNIAWSDRRDQLLVSYLK